MEQDQINDDGLVERLLAALADALRRTRRDPFGTPVTVAEIYQDLVPYRTVRTALGFQMNADYEHTVLRLLAGENELARLEPEEARDELRTELEMPNPNVGLFRKFAACDVWILRTELTLGDDGPSVEPSEPPPEHARFSPPPDASPPVPSVASQRAPTSGRAGQRPAVASREPEPEREVRAEMSGTHPQPHDSRLAPSPAAREAGDGEPPMLELETDMVADDADGAAVVTGSQLEWAEPEPEGEWDAAEGDLILEEEVQDPPEAPDTSEEPVRAHSHEPTKQPEAAVMFDSSQSQGNVATAKAGGSCAFCSASLPGGRVVRFCPFCGADQSMKPCGSCNEPLDPAWKFCIGCGNQQS